MPFPTSTGPRASIGQMEIGLTDRKVESVTRAGEIESIVVGAGSEPTETIIAERDVLTVSAGLDPQPDHEWRKLWERGDFPNDLDEPQFFPQGRRLFFTVAKDDLDARGKRSRRVSQTQTPPTPPKSSRAARRIRNAACAKSAPSTRRWRRRSGSWTSSSSAGAGRGHARSRAASAGGRVPQT